MDRMSWKKLIHVDAFRAVLRESDDGFKCRSIHKMSQLARRPAINTSKQWYRSDQNIVSSHSAHTLLLSDQPIPPTWSTYLDNPKNGWARNVQSVCLSSPTVLWRHFGRFRRSSSWLINTELWKWLLGRNVRGTSDDTNVYVVYQWK